MTIHIDDNDFYQGACLTKANPEDFVTMYLRHQYEFSESEVAARNESITKAWACPVLRLAQSVRSKANNRNGEAAVNAKRSSSLKVSHSNPETKAKISAVKTAYWVEWRAQRAAS